MKIDFHSHILPGIDDGAKTMEESVRLAASMAGWGFERITCTPHITRLYRNTPDIIRGRFETLQEELDRTGCTVELKMSAEYRLNPETWPEIIRRNWLMPIEDRYILMELPIGNPEEMGWLSPIDEFRKVLSLGLVPVLPHPERYFYLEEKALMSYVEAGVLIQCNYGSLAGLYGEDVRVKAQSYVDRGMVSLFGTDMHNDLYVKIIGKWFSEGNPIAEYR